MNKLKRVLSVLMALAVTGNCLVSCGNEEDESGTGTSSSSVEGADTIEPEPEPEVDNAIIIGCSGPLTGSMSQYGNEVRNAIDVAIDEVNNSGELGDIKLKAIFEDDKADSGEIAVEAYNNLKNNGMDILVGAVTSGSSIKIAELSSADNIFQLTPSASSPDVVKTDNCFQICYNDPNQGKASAEYISENNLGNKIAIIWDKSDGYSNGIYESFKSEALVRNIEIVSEAPFDAEHKEDFSSQVSSAQSAGADLVFIPVYYQDAANIIKAADAIKYKPTFFGCDGIDGIFHAEDFNLILADGTYFLSPFVSDATDDLSANFLREYRRRYGSTNDISQFAADAYDCVMILADLIKKENITPDMSPSEMCEKLKKAIVTDFTYDGITGLNMVWSSEGVVSKKPKAAKIFCGAYETPKFNTDDSSKNDEPKDIMNIDDTISFSESETD